MNKDKITLRNAVFNLNWNLCGISAEIERLEDVEILLNNLEDNMNETARMNDTYIVHAFKEHHRMVRVLYDVMSHSIKRIKEHYENIDNSQNILFDGLVRKEKEAAGKVGE